jgi:hypothetical protein
MALYKLGVFIGADEREYEYPQCFMREPTTGSERLCIAGNQGYRPYPVYCPQSLAWRPGLAADCPYHLPKLREDVDQLAQRPSMQ